MLYNTPGQGKVLATSAGMTLYKRDGYILQSGGGHSLRRGQPQRPAVGRDIGLNALCDAECAKVWHPFLAPADAQPRGFWDVATRPDGARQWVYQGYALWTYDGDKKPGDMNGNDSFQFAFADTPSMVKRPDAQDDRPGHADRRRAGAVLGHRDPLRRPAGLPARRLVRGSRGRPS